MRTTTPKSPRLSRRSLGEGRKPTRLALSILRLSVLLRPATFPAWLFFFVRRYEKFKSWIPDLLVLVELGSPLLCLLPLLRSLFRSIPLDFLDFGIQGRCSDLDLAWCVFSGWPHWSARSFWRHHIQALALGVAAGCRTDIGCSALRPGVRLHIHLIA
jgi:hypothetical protein